MIVDTTEIVDEQFKILKPLGRGYTADVSLAEHIETALKVALKIYKPIGNIKLLEKNFANEVTTMRGISHQNVVKIFAGNNEGVLKRPGNKDKTVMYMAVELCQGGEFFDYIAEPGKGFNENTARFYFQQLLNGLKGIHDSGLAHRDLKTENLFVDGEMNIKIGDFGFAKFIEPGNDKGLLKTALGTPGYQCPELLEGDNYSGTGNDISACGVILFIMYCGFPPFREAKKFDPWYRHFYNKNPNLFWNMHTKQKRTPSISDNFKELIAGMLSAKNRFTLDDVLKSKWVTEKEIDVDALKKDMQERWNIVNKNKEKLNCQMDVDDDDDSNQKVYRGGDNENEELQAFMQTFDEISFGDCTLDKWNDSEFKRNDYLKFKFSPKNLLHDVCSKLILKYPGIKVNLREGLYRGTVVYNPNQENLDEIEDIEQLPVDLEFDFDVYEDGDEGSVVQFSKNETMSQYDFKNFFNGLKGAYENN